MFPIVFSQVSVVSFSGASKKSDGWVGLGCCELAISADCRQNCKLVRERAGAHSLTDMPCTLNMEVNTNMQYCAEIFDDTIRFKWSFVKTICPCVSAWPWWNLSLTYSGVSCIHPIYPKESTKLYENFGRGNGSVAFQWADGKIRQIFGMARVPLRRGLVADMVFISSSNKTSVFLLKKFLCFSYVHMILFYCSFANIIMLNCVFFWANTYYWDTYF